MGVKLVKYFELVGEKGGLKAQMRLAMKCGVPSNKAAAAADTPELLEKAHSIAAEVMGPDTPKL